MWHSIKIRTGISTYRLQKRFSVSNDAEHDIDHQQRGAEKGPKEVEYSEAKQIIEQHFYNEGSLALRNFLSNNYLDQKYCDISNHEVLHHIIKQLDYCGELVLYKEEQKITIDPIEITEKPEPIHEEATDHNASLLPEDTDRTFQVPGPGCRCCLK